MAECLIDKKTGEIHLAGSFLLMQETICGNCDIAGLEIEYEYVDATPTCYGCIQGAKHILSIATVKEIKSW